MPLNKLAFNFIKLKSLSFTFIPLKSLAFILSNTFSSILSAVALSPSI